MKFFENLYLGPKVPNVAKIKRQILNRSFFAKAHVIALANGDDQLDIFDAKVLRQSYYVKHPRTIVAIASDYDEAVELVIQITQDALRQGYQGNIKDFLIDMETK